MGRRIGTSSARALARGAIAVVDLVEPSDEEQHFAIVTAVTATAVVFRDPWNGPRVMLPRREFLRRWNGHYRLLSGKIARPTRRWAAIIPNKKNPLAR